LAWLLLGSPCSHSLACCHSEPTLTLSLLTVCQHFLQLSTSTNTSARAHPDSNTNRSSIIPPISTNRLSTNRSSTTTTLTAPTSIYNQPNRQRQPRTRIYGIGIGTLIIVLFPPNRIDKVTVPTLLKQPPRREDALL